MPLTTLVVCCDPQLLQKIIPVFEVAGIETDVCTRTEDAEQKLAATRYDATLIDFASLAGAREVLDRVRRSGSNHSAVTFAIVSEITTPREAAALGASFVLEKSFSQEWLLRNLHAAQGLMAVENRRYYRHGVDFGAWLQRPSDRMGELPVSITDISQGGLGLRSAVALAESTTLELRFTLPGASAVDAQARVVWCHGGRAGLQFTKMSSKSRAMLVDWLMEQYERTQPPLPAVPPSMSQSTAGALASYGRRLLCHAFAQNLPIAWKCSDCGWKTSIKLDETRWRYANEPPENVVSSFRQHECSQFPRERMQ